MAQGPRIRRKAPKLPLFSSGRPELAEEISTMFGSGGTVEHLKINGKQARALGKLLKKLDETKRWHTLNLNNVDDRLVVSPSLDSDDFFQYTIDKGGRTVKV